MKTLLLKELRWNWRSFRYPAFLLVVLFFALLDPPMTKYTSEIITYFAEGLAIVMPDPTPEDAFVAYLSDVSQIGILVLIFVAMGSVSREKETGVTGWILSKPVSRWQYLAAKVIVLYLTIILGILGCSTLAYLYTTTLLGTFSLAGAAWATMSLIAFVLLFGTVVFTFSTILKSPLQAGGLTLTIFFLMGILNLFVAGTEAARLYPSTLISQLRPLVEGTTALPEIAEPLAVSLGLCALLLFLAGRRFARMEL
ncbi:MAG TPA: ABC transporter permease subunit [Candidatus Limnocylindrales bacterium]|nr:ABC transporter permease subunit [Candidatus Limnocylindrales bacterium]